MRNLKTLAVAAAMSIMFACGEKTDDGKLLELYFTDSTSLTRNEETVAFDQLAEGKKVEVVVEKVGNKLDPKAVRILE